MNTPSAGRRPGPTGRPTHLFVLPATLGGKLWVWRYLLLRRLTQFGVLTLFFGTAHFGWTLLGRPVLAGNLSGSEFLGFLPMADPFAVAQILLTRHWLESKVLLGAGLILALYTLVGGRVFCAWVCPVNMMTDGASWLRRRFGVKDTFYLDRRTRYSVLALALVLSVLTGVAAFEWISPIGMFHRELIYGVGLGWTAVLGVFLFDLFVLKHGWCGHLCPLGAFYALVGRVAPVRVRFDEARCTHCGECTQVCPEPHVLNLKQAAAAGMIASGECTNCGRCTPVCPEGALHFDLRARIRRGLKTVSDSDPSRRRAA